MSIALEQLKITYRSITRLNRHTPFRRIRGIARGVMGAAANGRPSQMRRGRAIRLSPARERKPIGDGSCLENNRA